MSKYWSKIPKKKLGIFIGFLIAFFPGAFCASALMTMALEFLSAPVLAITAMSYCADIIGGLFAMGCYLQLCKDFKSWPMDVNPPAISFSPSKLLKDIVAAFRAADVELLRVVSEICVEA